MTIFDDLFVLELANNHEGRAGRGRDIINRFADVVEECGVRATIKLQFRCLPNFVHPAWRNIKDVRYVTRTMQTALNMDECAHLCDEIRRRKLLVSATPFDEESVEWCRQFGVDILKVASSDLTDGPLVDAVLSLHRPVIASTAGWMRSEIDHFVWRCDEQQVEHALNHCVAIYPSQDRELELNQITRLRDAYPRTVIGFSTHECTSWDVSMFLSYGLGARMWERHIDLEREGKLTAPYCSTPDQIRTWFKAYHQARKMCGGGGKWRIPAEKEIKYLDSLARGYYALTDMAVGNILRSDALYLAIPLQRGQLSSRESGQVLGQRLIRPVKALEPITIDHVDFNVPDADRRRIAWRSGI